MSEQLAQLRKNGVSGTFGKMKSGVVYQTTSGVSTFIDCGFRPKYILLTWSSNFNYSMRYNADQDPNNVLMFNGSWYKNALPNSEGTRINSISDTGFTFKLNYANVTYYYVAATDEI